MPRIFFAVVMFSLCLSIACAPAFSGRWDGSGEVGEARFFSFELELAGRNSTGRFGFTDQIVAEGAVCGLVEQDGHVEFVMGTGGNSSDCANLAAPLTFVGDFGRDVLTGIVLDRSSGGGERLVGLFRAFRAAGRE